MELDTFPGGEIENEQPRFTNAELGQFGFFAPEGCQFALVEPEESSETRDLDGYVIVTKDLFEPSNGVAGTEHSDGLPFLQDGDYVSPENGKYVDAGLELGARVATISTASAAAGMDTVVPGIINPIDFEKAMVAMFPGQDTVSIEQAQEILATLEPELAVQGSSGGAGAAKRFVEMVPELTTQVFGENVTPDKIIWFESDLSGSARDPSMSTGFNHSAKLRASNTREWKTDTIFTLSDQVISGATPEQTAYFSHVFARHLHPDRAETSEHWPGLSGREAKELGNMALVPSLDGRKTWNGVFGTGGINGDPNRRKAVEIVEERLNDSSVPETEVIRFDEGPQRSSNRKILAAFTDAAALAAIEDMNGWQQIADDLTLGRKLTRKDVSNVVAALNIRNVDPGRATEIQDLITDEREELRRWMEERDVGVLISAEPGEQYPKVGKGHILPGPLSLILGAIASNRDSIPGSESSAWSWTTRELSMLSLGYRLPDDDAWSGLWDTDDVCFNIHPGGDSLPRAIQFSVPHIQAESYADHPDSQPQVTAGNLLALAYKDGGPLHDLVFPAAQS